MYHGSTFDSIQQTMDQQPNISNTTLPTLCHATTTTLYTLKNDASTSYLGPPLGRLA
jgi:hypothetical protein